MKSSSILEIIDVSTVADKDEKGMMNLYYRIYNAIMESNMSITKKVNLFKHLMNSIILLRYNSLSIPYILIISPFIYQTLLRIHLYK